MSPSIRSSGAIVALPPAAWIRSSTSSSACAVRATRMTWAPARGERLGGRRADAAAGAGDKRELAGKRFRIGHGGARCSG